MSTTPPDGAAATSPWPITRPGRSPAAGTLRERTAGPRSPRATPRQAPHRAAPSLASSRAPDTSRAPLSGSEATRKQCPCQAHLDAPRVTLRIKLRRMLLRQPAGSLRMSRLLSSSDGNRQRHLLPAQPGQFKAALAWSPLTAVDGAQRATAASAGSQREQSKQTPMPRQPARLSGLQPSRPCPPVRRTNRPTPALVMLA